MKKILLLIAASLLLPSFAACQRNLHAISKESASETQETEKQTDNDSKPQKPADFDDKGNLTLDGWSDYVIVIAKSCETAERTAAAELRNYIKKISGATLSIVSDENEVSEKEIVVGKTNRENEGEFDRNELGSDGFIIKTRDRKLFLVGGEPRGTLYSVYAYLEDYLGCRFYTADFEKIPHFDPLPFFTIEEDKQIPVFETRNSGWADLYDHNLSVKLKLNCSHGRGKISDSLGGSEFFAGNNCHTLYALAELTDSNVNKEPCLTDEAVYQTVLKNVRALLDANPGAKYVSVSQNDGSVNDACYCDNCTSLREELGGWSDHYINFVNKIADAIKADYPDVMVHTFAYKFTKDAPKTVTPAENVMVQFCTIEGCFRHSLTECTAHGADFEKLISEWSDVCDYLAVWDYTTDFYYYSISFPNFEAIYDNMRLFADNNVKKVYEQGNWQTTSGEFAELRGYLISRLLWDPYMSKETYYAYMDEFLLDYYGAGAPKIREYIDYMQSVTKDSHLGIYDSPDKVYPNTLVTHRESGLPEGFSADVLKDYKSVDWSQYYDWYSSLEPNEIIAKGKALFDEARAMTNDEEQLYHINKSSLQLDFMESYYRYYELALIRENMTRLISELVDTYMDLGEESVLKSTMVTNVMRPLEKDYEKYNELLFARFFDYGINYVGEARRIDQDKKSTYDFSKTPDSWGPNTWAPENKNQLRPFITVGVFFYISIITKLSVSGLPETALSFMLYLFAMLQRVSSALG